MNWKKISILLLVLIVGDQILKIWVKTNMHLGEAIVIFPNWFQLHFIENNGAAFGMQIASSGGFDWGKIALSVFRVGMVGAMLFYVRHLLREKAPVGVIVALVAIIAGAIGNIIDSALYGVIFFGIDANDRCPLWRKLRAIYDGSRGRYVLLPAIPMEQLPGLAVVLGRCEQLLFRSNFQPCRRLYLGSGRLSAYFPVAFFQVGGTRATHTFAHIKQPE